MRSSHSRLVKKSATVISLEHRFVRLGDVDMRRKNYSAALSKYEVVLTLANSIRNTFLEASVLHRIGKLNFEQKRYDASLLYLLKTLEISQRYHHQDELERTYKLIVEVYRAKNDLKNAFDYQTQYVIIHDSLNDQRNSEQVALLQARFDSEIKETKIELLTKEAQLKQEEINSQRVWMYFYIGSCSLFMLLAVVLLVQLQREPESQSPFEGEESAHSKPGAGARQYQWREG